MPASQALVLAYPASLPRTSEIVIDVPVLLFALGVSMAPACSSGSRPSRGGRGDLVTVAQGGRRPRRQRPGRHRIRRALVMAEVALAMMLVTGAGLLLRTVYNLTRVDAGFDRSRLVTFSMTLPRAHANMPTDARRCINACSTHFAAHRACRRATAMSDLPLNRFVQGFSTRIENEPAATGQTSENRRLLPVRHVRLLRDDGHPDCRRPRLRPGRHASLDRVVVVNETLANRLWKGRNPIGQRLRPNLSASMGTSNNPWHTVIGVAKDVKEGGVDRQAGTELYMFTRAAGAAYRWHGTPMGGQRSAHDERGAADEPAARGAVADARGCRSGRGPGGPVVRLRDMDAVFAESIRRPRLLAQLLGAFAGLALLLAAVGTYGVLSYMVTERRREIGIRMALGAARSSVIALVMKQGLQAPLVGVVVGARRRLRREPADGDAALRRPADRSSTLAAVIATDHVGGRHRLLVAGLARVAAGSERGAQS